MKRAGIVALSLSLALLIGLPVEADTIDPYTTSQALTAKSGQSNSSTATVPTALGGKRSAGVVLFGTGLLTSSVAGGAVTYKLVGSGSQGGRIGWLQFAGATPATPVDLTAGGAFDAFQVEVLEVTEAAVVQVDAVDANGRSDSVMTIVSAKPAQPLVFSFSSFISPDSPAKVDFTKIVGVQIEFDLHATNTGLLKLGPLTTIKAAAAATERPASSEGSR